MGRPSKADQDQRTVDVLHPGIDHAAYAQQLTVQGAVLVLGGDHEFLAGPYLQLVKQPGPYHCVARICGADHAVGGQGFEKRVDLAFPVRVNTDQHDSPALPARLCKGRDIQAGQDLLDTVYLRNIVDQGAIFEIQGFIAAFKIVVSVDGNMSRAGADTAVDHAGVDAEREVVQRLHQHDAEGNCGQGDNRAAPVAPDILPGQSDKVHR